MLAYEHGDSSNHAIAQHSLGGGALGIKEAAAKSIELPWSTSVRHLN